MWNDDGHEDSVPNPIRHPCESLTYLREHSSWQPHLPELLSEWLPFDSIQALNLIGQSFVSSYSLKFSGGSDNRSSPSAPSAPQRSIKQVIHICKVYALGDKTLLPRLCLVGEGLSCFTNEDFNMCMRQSL